MYEGNADGDGILVGTVPAEGIDPASVTTDDDDNDAFASATWDQRTALTPRPNGNGLVTAPRSLDSVKSVDAMTAHDHGMDAAALSGDPIDTSTWNLFDTVYIEETSYITVSVVGTTRVCDLWFRIYVRRLGV
jgi:hypothetical protein